MKNENTKIAIDMMFALDSFSPFAILERDDATDEMAFLKQWIDESLIQKILQAPKGDKEAIWEIIHDPETEGFLKEDVFEELS